MNKIPAPLPTVLAQKGELANPANAVGRPATRRQRSRSLGQMAAEQASLVPNRALMTGAATAVRSPPAPLKSNAAQPIPPPQIQSHQLQSQSQQQQLLQVREEFSPDFFTFSPDFFTFSPDFFLFRSILSLSHISLTTKRPLKRVSVVN
jgi:hypothetical protein